MTTGATLSLEQLDAAVAAVAPKLTDSEQRLAVTIYRMRPAGQGRRRRRCHRGRGRRR